MANELQQITFPVGWLGVGGGVRFTFDSSAFPNGFFGDTGFYTTWDSSYTAADWRTEVSNAMYIAFGFNTTVTLVQATEPVILQVEFTDCTAPPFGPDLGDLDVPEIEIPNWYSNGSAAIPTVATVRDGDDTIFEMGTGGARCGGTAPVQLTTTQTASGGATAGGIARIIMGYLPTGGVVTSGHAIIVEQPRIGGGATVSGSHVNQMIRNPSTSGGVKILTNAFSTGYYRRHTITIPAGTFANDLADVLLPIKIQADADHVTSNIRFTDVNDQRLGHDLVAIQSGKVFAFVKTNITANTEKKIRMYFDPVV